MNRESLVWGLVGGLSFLVLLQGFELVADRRVSLLAKFGVAILVTAGATLLTQRLRHRLAGNESA